MARLSGARMKGAAHRAAAPVAAAGFLDIQINLKLYGGQGRIPTDSRTAWNARIANTGS